MRTASGFGWEFPSPGLRRSCLLNTRSALVTFAAICAFYLISYIPLPFLTMPLATTEFNDRFTIGALGIRPAVFAFLIVELMSFVLPPLQRWRMGGLLGRARLTQLAFATTGVIAFAQAIAITRILTGDPLDGLRLIEGSYQHFTIVGTISLMGGTAVSLLIAATITIWGSCNGILMILLAQTVKDLIPNLNKMFFDVHATTPETNFTGFLLLILAIAAAFYAVTKEPKANAHDTQGPLPFQLPGLPTSLFQTTDMGPLFIMLGSVFSISSSELYPSLPQVLGLVLSTLLTCIAFYWVFNSEESVNRAIQGEARLDSAQPQSRKRLYYVLTAITVITLMPLTVGSVLGSVGVATVLLLSTVLADIRAQWIFTRRHPDQVCLLAMDNVHLAEVFRARLAREGIESYLQGASYRRQVFIFNPLVKMRLLVPKSAAPRAQSILSQSETERLYL